MIMFILIALLSFIFLFSFVLEMVNDKFEKHPVIYVEIIILDQPMKHVKASW